MTTREDAALRLLADQERLSGKLSLTLDTVVPNVLKKYGVRWRNPQPGAFDEVANNASKDLEKLALYQEDSIDPLKQMGYAAFWIRKIKPLDQSEVQGKAAYVAREINERLSIWLACEALRSHWTKVAKADSKESGRSKAISSRIDSYLADADSMGYLVHCMRSRTFGPHHYVMMLNNLSLP